MTAANHEPVGNVTEEAAGWFARLRRETVSDEERNRFQDWLASHPARRQAFDEMNALWNGLDALAGSPEESAERNRVTGDPDSSHGVRWINGVSWALAACLVLTVGIGLWYRLSTPTRFETQLGEQRTVALSDGSVATLNTASQVRVRFTAGERRVELIRGQAIFSVAPEESRPFIVDTAGGEVRALGTEFDVYQRKDDVVVTLLQGRVAVMPDSAPTSGERAAAEARAVVLEAGQQVAYRAGDVALVPVEVDPNRAAAWRRRKLDFDDTPLTQAIEEANRYSSVKVELRAPSLTDARISGVFDAGQNEAFAEGVRAYFGLNLVHAGDRLIVLTPPRD